MPIAVLEYTSLLKNTDSIPKQLQNKPTFCFPVQFVYLSLMNVTLQSYNQWMQSQVKNRADQTQCQNEGRLVFKWVHIICVNWNDLMYRVSVNLLTHFQIKGKHMYQEKGGDKQNELDAHRPFLRIVIHVSQSLLLNISEAYSF